MSSTLDKEQEEKFKALADQWWDANGPMRPLHHINPLRTEYILKHWQRWNDQSQSQQTLPLAAVKTLDIGCGGGLLTEELCRQGAQVSGIDAAENLIEVAKAHSENQNLATIDYRHTLAEDLLPEQQRHFDLVCCLEVIEHSPQPEKLVQCAADLLRPGGVAVFSTINRTARAFVTAILGAEYLLQILPRGTHSYAMLVKPAELAQWGRNAGLALKDISGLSYNPFTGKARLNSDVAVNYLAVFQKL
ncbi:MAG: bifunctional 2-polyprenyl-6-hydroxyphenol methylase/3-demethylubiquinol 3-O-methyltransferase UbiG [Gammaproteobacteria bacterium]